jgi:stress-induced morphogen
VKKMAVARPVLQKASHLPPQQLYRHGVQYTVHSAGTEAADTSGAPEGQISTALIENMRQKIGEALETDQVSIQDVYGDGRHVSIDVVSAAFEGKNSVARQRLVYKVSA